MLAHLDLFVVIGVLVIVSDLIITGIIGLIRKEIHAKNIFLQLFFLPLGIVGKIVAFFWSKIDDKVDRGNTAVASSIATIAAGLLISVIYGFYFLDTYHVVSYEMIEILVRVCLVALIVGIPAMIMFVISRSNKK